MRYRHLGAAGIQVSELSYGSWVTFHKQIDVSKVTACMKLAYEAGVNFFDNAEAYAGGESERLMGAALKKLGWRRASYLVSTKLFWGLNDGPNERNTLNRKYLLEAIDGSLSRLQLEYVDLLFCHRPDPATPIEETVWAMHDIIARGKALYWGTSEWSADAISEAIAIAEKHHLRKPIMEQPEYNLFKRQRFEKEYAPIFAQHRIGSTTWSPLASGILTGKYLAGLPKNSRLSLEGMEWLRDRLMTQEHMSAVRSLAELSEQIGCSLAQLAIAWCLGNENVSTVILGATSVEQLGENLAAEEYIERITPDIRERIDEILAKEGIEV